MLTPRSRSHPQPQSCRQSQRSRQRSRVLNESLGTSSLATRGVKSNKQARYCAACSQKAEKKKNPSPP
eukprot:1990918-Amphidinium_carterae.1